MLYVNRSRKMTTNRIGWPGESKTNKKFITKEII